MVLVFLLVFWLVCVSKVQYSIDFIRGCINMHQCSRCTYNQPCRRCFPKWPALVASVFQDAIVLFVFVGVIVVLVVVVRGEDTRSFQENHNKFRLRNVYAEKYKHS